MVEKSEIFVFVEREGFRVIGAVRVDFVEMLEQIFQKQYEIKVFDCQHLLFESLIKD